MLQVPPLLGVEWELAGFAARKEADRVSKATSCSPNLSELLLLHTQTIKQSDTSGSNEKECMNRGRLD